MVMSGGWIPALSAPIPIRQVGQQSAWSTPASALQRFVSTGEIKDRGLLQLIKQSGWSNDDLRLALAKLYRVDGIGLARFLATARGDRFLQEQLGSYGPSHAPQTAMVGLRSAILSAAATGQLSSMDLLAHLPTDFDLRHQNGRSMAAMPVCGNASQLKAEQRSSWLSWLVFLPACLQAASYTPLNARPDLQPGR
jgi:hypothetical protein